MRSSQDICTAALAWARATVPELAGGYDYIPSMSDQPLPDVVVDVATVSLVTEDRRFPFEQIQQAWVRAYDTEFSFMVDNTDYQAAAAKLREFEKALTASLLRDGSLGGRVDFISPFHTFDFTPPFVERADGTRGREMVMRLSIAELVQEEF